MSAPIGGPEASGVGSGSDPIGQAPPPSLGGVFSGGLPLGGPVTQIVRGESAPTPSTLFVRTLSSSGPIGGLLIGLLGEPIGAETFGRGGLPIEAPQAKQGGPGIGSLG